MCCFSQLFACALAKSFGIYFLLILTVLYKVRRCSEGTKAKPNKPEVKENN
jgi:hypothetical protein